MHFPIETDIQVRVSDYIYHTENNTSRIYSFWQQWSDLGAWGCLSPLSQVSAAEWSRLCIDSSPSRYSTISPFAFCSPHLPLCTDVKEDQKVIQNIIKITISYKQWLEQWMSLKFLVVRRISTLYLMKRFDCKKLTQQIVTSKLKKNYTTAENSFSNATLRYWNVFIFISFWLSQRQVLLSHQLLLRWLH